MNATWHRRHRMTKSPTPEQRLRWHLEHDESCGCRPLPKRVRAELERRAGAGRRRPATS